MTSDDERIEYLSGGPAAGSGADPELDDLRDLLADPALWAEPGIGLEDAVVAAVADAARAEAGRPSAPRATPRPRRWALVGAAAAVAVVAVGVGVGLAGSGGDAEADMEVALRPPSSGTDGAAPASAELTRTDSGWRIELSAPELPRLAGDQLYTAWLRSDDGTLVPVGTFNEGDAVVLWAGVPPADYPTLTVTREDVLGDPGSSGDQVLVGRIDD